MERYSTDKKKALPIWRKSIMSILGISILITAGIVAANMALDFHGFMQQDVGQYALICFLLCFALTATNALYYNGLSLRYDWGPKNWRKMALAALGSLALTMMVYFLVRFFIAKFFFGRSWNDFIQGETVGEYLVAFIIAVIASLFVHALHFYRVLNESKVKEQKIIAGTASAQFNALKNQLDPHFLFNSLNVLTSLIEENPEKSQSFTTSLSIVYRYVLEQKDKELVSVDEELAFARTYVKLLKMRFEESIELSIPEKASDPEAKIVPLSLQLLLENAVKHNRITPSEPLRIRIFEEDGSLAVANNLQEKEVIKKSIGVGLRNIQDRYRLLTDRQTKIEKTGTEFAVRLPMLTKQIHAMETQEMHIDEKRYKKAKEQVDEIKGFYGNLASYCIIIPILAVVNYNTTSFPWVVFPLLGWGFGVLMHGMETFGYNPLFGKRWEERKIRKFMEDDDF